MENEVGSGDCLLRQHNVAAYVQGQELGLGVLVVEESCLRWTSESQIHELSLEYPNIVIHGISRDTTTFPHSCVYLLHSISIGSDLEEGEGQEGAEEEHRESLSGEDEEAIEEERGEDTQEIRFVPADENQLSTIYEAISQCQLLYPDSQVSEEDEEGLEGEDEAMVMAEDDEGYTGGDGVGYFTTPEGLQHLTSEGKVVLEHLERVFQLPSQEEFVSMVASSDETEGQFEDAD